MENECRDSVPFRFAKSKESPPSSRRQAICHRHIAFDGSNLDQQTEKTGNYVSSLPFFGPSVEIRTRGLLNPIQARYQTSPHPDRVAERLRYDSTVDWKNQVLFSVTDKKFQFKIPATEKKRLYNFRTKIDRKGRICPFTHESGKDLVNFSLTCK